MCTDWAISVRQYPALDISVLINNLTTASTRRARNRITEHLAAFYKKPQFWHRAYFVGSVSSVGNATPETVRAHADAQGPQEHARKAVGKARANDPKPPGTKAIQNQSARLPPPVRSA